MTVETADFPSRVRVHLDLQGAVLTDAELARVAERYPRCPGTEPWGIREYARPTGLGAREYRVVRGSGMQNVYCSAERVSAAAVQAALNDLESQHQTGGRI